MLEVTAQFVTENWAILFTIGAFLATNIAGIVAFLIQRQVDYRFRVREEKLNRLRSQKNDFYDQILSLISINEQMFKSFGPPSFQRASEQKRSDLAREWESVRSDIVLPNNMAISELIRTKAHLLNDSDSINEYRELLTHIAAYPLFLTAPTERYSETMRFPAKIVQHLTAQRDKIICALGREGAL